MALYVDATWTRFCDEADPAARFVVAEVDIDRLGLRVAYDEYVARAAPPDVKEAPKPPNKAARRPPTK